MKAEQGFDTQVRRQLASLRSIITSLDCAQLKLIDPGKLSTLTRDNKTSDFQTHHIVKLWQLGLLQADLVETRTRLRSRGLLFCGHSNRGGRLYVDQRTPRLPKGSIVDSFKGLTELRRDISLHFHPFRCYVLHRLHNVLRQRASSVQTLMYSPGLCNLNSLHLKSLRRWWKKHQGRDQISFWNDLTTLVAILEPPVYSWISQRVTWSGFGGSYEATMARLRLIQVLTGRVLQRIGTVVVEEYRDRLVRDAEWLDRNKNLHLVVRLMDVEERDNLKGQIAGAMLFQTMAECIRRSLEKLSGQRYPEEDELGFGWVYPHTKMKLHGGTRVLDGDRPVTNQFLRRLGLDYGVRAVVYVEGVTEFNAIEAEFEHERAIQLVNLRGSVVQKHGKGVAFRDSLRNDLRAQLFSIVLLDGDRSDNLRAVKLAAKNDEFCGAFYVSTPDFEFGNFSQDELCRVVATLVSDKGGHIDLSDLQAATCGASNADEFLRAVSTVLPDGCRIHKGGEWGRALLQHAVGHPIGGELGGEADRVINKAIRTVYQCIRANFAYVKQEMRVAPETGEPMARDARQANGV